MGPSQISCTSCPKTSTKKTSTSTASPSCWRRYDERHGWYAYVRYGLWPVLRLLIRVSKLLWVQDQAKVVRKVVRLKPRVLQWNNNSQNKVTSLNSKPTHARTSISILSSA